MPASIKKNYIFNLLLTGSNLLFPLLTFPYLSRIIGAEGLGACNFILSYCQNFIIVAALGLPIYGIREIGKYGDDKAKRSELFYELLFSQLAFTLIALIVYVISIILYHDFQNYRQLTIMGAAYILFSTFTIEWLFGGVSDFKYITIRSLIIRAISVVAIFLFVRQRSDFNIYFGITVLTVIVTASININYARKYVLAPSGFSFKKIFSHFRPVLLLGVYMVLTSIYSVLPMTLLGFLSTKTAVGYFYSANKIILMTISVFTALTTVVFPRLSQYVENEDKSEYFSVINKAFNIVITIGIPVTLLIYLLADPIVMLLSGKEFLSSIPCTRIMAPLILMIGFAQVFVIMILNVNRKEKQMVYLSAAGMAISLVINLLFIPVYAEKASAYAQLVSELAVTIVSFFVARRVVRFVFPFKVLGMNLLFSVMFIPLVHIGMSISGNHFVQILISGLMCGSYYIVYQFLVLKDKFLLELVDPFIVILRNSFSRP